jgi:hypothetical protein
VTPRPRETPYANNIAAKNLANCYIITIGPKHGMYIEGFYQNMGVDNKSTCRSAVAFISDKSFLFDEVELFGESLQNKKISSVTQIAREDAIPVNKHKILSGFLVNQGTKS